MLRKDEIATDENPLLVREKRYRSFFKLTLMILNICLSSFYFGYSMQYLGTFEFSHFMKIYHINWFEQNTAQGLLQGAVSVGAGIGAFCSLFLMKKFSRKQHQSQDRNCLLLVNAIAIVFGLVLFIQTQFTFFLARIMQGFCVGLYSALAPLIIKQFAPNEISGTLGTFNQLLIAFGVFFACLLQYILDLIYKDQLKYWKFMFSFTLFTTIIQTILLIFVYKYETPKYLLENNREQECKQVLAYIYFDEFVEETFEEKLKDLNKNKEHNVTSFQGASLISEADSVKIGQKTKKNGYRLLISINLAMLQQLIGINAITIFGPQIVRKVYPQLTTLIPVIINFQQTFTCFLTGFLLLKFGRKTILQMGTLVGIFALLLVGTGFALKKGEDVDMQSTVLIIGGLIIFMGNFGLSLGPVVWLYIPEVLEPSRVPISTAFNWASSSLIVITFPILNNILKKDNHERPQFLFFGYAILSTIGFFITQKYAIETKGKTQKEIYEEYQRKFE